MHGPALAGGTRNSEHLLPGGRAHAAVHGKAAALLVAADGLGGLRPKPAVGGQGLTLAPQLLLDEPDGAAAAALVFR